MNKSSNTSADSEPAGWEHLPPALRMAAMSGRVNPKYTNDRKKADEALSSALKESIDDRNKGPRYNWDRNKESSSRQVQAEERRQTLREEAEAMRRRLAQLDGKAGTSSSPAPAPAMEEPTSHHDIEMLKKKLKKVDKLIAKEAPGSKEYKKLQKKRAEYLSQIGAEVQEEDTAAIDRKEQLRSEARRKREEAERAAAEKLRMQRDAEAEEKRRQRDEIEAFQEEERKRKEAFREEARRLREEAIERKRREEQEREDIERQRKEAIREEARRLKEEALARKQREEEERKGREEQERDDIERQRKEAIREEARRLKEEALAKKQREEVAAVEKQRQKEAFLEEARRLKVEAQERKRKDEEKAATISVMSNHETDEEKRKKAFLEEARALKQAAMEKKHQEEEVRVSDTNETEEQKRKDAFLEEARQLKAAAMAKKEAEATKEARSLFVVEAEEADIQTQAPQLEREHIDTMGSPRTEVDNLRREAPTKQPEQEASHKFLDRRSLPEPYSENTKKILRELESMESSQKKLEKSLVQNGIPVTEDIPYEVAKDKIAEITESMKELASADMDPYAMEKKYNCLEEELAKYSNALMLTDEYAEEQNRIEQEWEDAIEADNIAALQKIWSHMPVNVKSMTEDELASTPTPNGKSLPVPFARKFKRTNILQLLRVNPEEIEKMHPSLLEGIRTTGLTLTERRAIHEHLRDVAERWEKKLADPSSEKKYQWFQVLKMKFKEMLNTYTTHVEKYGPPENHPYASRNDPSGGGCPMLGNQCPLKADAVLNYNEDLGYPQEALFENGSQGTNNRSSREKKIQSNLTSKSKASDIEITNELRERLGLDSHENDVDKKLLRELFHAEKRTRSLEKQLTQAGLALPQEDISYSMAKTKIAGLTGEIKDLAAKMGNCTDSREMARLEVDFGKLSQELDKYNNAIMLTKEWAKEQEDRERNWEASISQANYEALQKIWRHMPVNIRDLSEDVLSSAPTPNGKTLPTAMAKKFKRTNILMLLRLDPSDIEPMHPSSLEAMRTTGLTLTERRALHEHLKTLAPKWQASSNDKMSERKWMWHASLKGKFKEVLEKYEHHVQQYGPPHNHPYAERNNPSGGGCPLLGNQCPVKADLVTDYNDDYGFPDYPIYMKETVAKSNLMTMEELERRRQEDEMEHGGYNSAPASAPVAKNSSSDGTPVGHMAIGMMSAIQKPPVKEESSNDNPSVPRPPMGGLMAEIQTKGAAKQECVSVESPTKKKKLGLLAAITGRGRS
ncbi:hypothetical protein IV203_018383 [Nitzschia inconspicua]|uniref:Uncharacterized protein n=1 Tax=Nitzschia inconspicua TaxID=303405 RepID=A0A9K3M2R0_9STRA|nr:hypothetical protein IV203_018383 [Nitzschia inconspicua]